MDQPRSSSGPPQTTATGQADLPGAHPVTSQPSDRAASQPPLPERDLWMGRMHWQNAIGRVTFWLVLNVAMAVAAYYGPRNSWCTKSRVAWVYLGFFAVTSIFLLGAVLFRILQNRYRLTSQRLFIEKGILARTMDQTELIRVDDVRMQQSFVNRVFNIGTVLVMTTDATDRALAIVGIKDPIRVTELIRQQMRTLRGRTVFVENV